MARKKIEKTESVDMQKAIRMCVDSGKVSLGMSNAKKKVLNGQGKLVIISSNTPLDDRSDLEKYAKISKIPALDVAEDSKELGSLCGKPFPVSALLVMDAGDSPILNLIKK